MNRHTTSLLLFQRKHVTQSTTQGSFYAHKRSQSKLPRTFLIRFLKVTSSTNNTISTGSVRPRPLRRPFCCRNLWNSLDEIAIPKSTNLGQPLIGISVKISQTRCLPERWKAKQAPYRDCLHVRKSSSTNRLPA